MPSKAHVSLLGRRFFVESFDVSGFVSLGFCHSFHLWSGCTYCWQIRCCVGQKIMPLSRGPEGISLETSSVAFGLGSSIDFRGPGKGEQIPGGILILQSLPNALPAWCPHPVSVSLLLACSFLGHILNHKNRPRVLPTLMCVVSLYKSQSQPSENLTVANPPHTVFFHPGVF